MQFTLPRFLALVFMCKWGNFAWVGGLLKKYHYWEFCLVIFKCDGACSHTSKNWNFPSFSIETKSYQKPKSWQTNESLSYSRNFNRIPPKKILAKSPLKKILPKSPLLKTDELDKFSLEGCTYLFRDVSWNFCPPISFPLYILGFVLSLAILNH